MQPGVFDRLLKPLPILPHLLCMTLKIQIVFYSMYGHIYRMAEAVAEGAREVEGAEVALYQVPELVPEEALERSGAKAARSAFAHVPIIQPAQLAEADAIIFGAPTRFGNMCAQMRNFLDQTGGLWAKGALIGKVGSVFTATATQHGGQETTLTSFHTTLLHHGMVIVGTPYSESRQTIVSEITGGSPYGASTITGGDGKRLPSDNELAIARFQGRHVATIARRLITGK
jgi:NAD(P)H dehydrogenase (quinone)